MTLDRRSLLTLAAAASLGTGPYSAGPAHAQARGALRVAVDSEYRNWNPAQVASNGVAIVARKIVETLFDLGPDAKTLVPVLATGWTPGADLRSHRFTLRPNVTWHDGRPFTADDVAFSALSQWKTLQNFGRDVFRTLDAVETPDPLTAVFRFTRPMPEQLLAAALPALCFVVPRHVYEGGDQAQNPANVALVGTGPFRYGEYRRGEVYRVVRNPNHWAGAALERIDFRIVPDKGAVAASLEAGEIDLACFGGVSIEDAERLGRTRGFAATAKGYEALLYTGIVEFNFDRPELKDPRVRHAIAHALDAAGVVSTILRGFGSVASSPVPRTDPVFHATGLPAYPFDPRRAEALLDEAGHPRGAGGMRFALRIVPAPFFDQTRRIGDAMRQSLRAIGIDASVVATDLPGYFAAVYRNRAFDLTAGVYVHRQDPAISMAALYRSGTPAGVPFSNQRGWQSAEMDALLAEAEGEVDPGRRVAAYAAVQRLSMTELPLIPLVEFPLPSVFTERLRNSHDDPRWAVTGWERTTLG